MGCSYCRKKEGASIEEMRLKDMKEIEMQMYVFYKYFY